MAVTGLCRWPLGSTGAMREGNLKFLPHWFLERLSTLLVQVLVAGVVVYLQHQASLPVGNVPITKLVRANR